MSASPYPGLRPFRRDEAHLFFGRDAQIEQLLDKLAEHRFLSVVGLSGCGKSSLVRAGVIPALESGLMVNTSSRWLAVEMRPGNRPMLNLTQALHKQFVPQTSRLRSDEETAITLPSLPFLLASLRRGALSLIEVFRAAPLPRQTNLLILVDQFEELFRYERQENRDENEAFVNLLLASVKQDEIPIYVVTTMRSEFSGECALFYDLPETMNQGQFLTPRLTRQQQREAIVEPAQLFHGAIEPRLVNTLLNEMGADPDQLPVLQHCLGRMWLRAGKRNPHPDPLPEGEGTELPLPLGGEGWGEGGILITFDDYEAVGGLKNALSNHADEAFSELNVKQQQIAEIMFRRLSKRDPGQRDTRHPVKVQEVAAVAGVTVSEASEVANVFRHPTRCFLIPPINVALEIDTVLDINHESLIQRWQRMKVWVEQEAESAEIYRRLEQTARLWKEGKAAVWGSPDLENALIWKEREKPTAEWASRYGDDFELAILFLDASEQEVGIYRRLEQTAQLWNQGKAALWSTPDLEFALAWKERKHPTPEWATRYGGDFGLAMEFLDVSAQAHKEKQRRTARRRRRILTGVLAGLILALCLASWAWWEREKAGRERDNADKARIQAEEALERAEQTEQRRTSGLFESYLTHAALQARIEDYAAARDILNQSRELDPQIPAERRHARNLLAWFTDLMGGTPDKEYAGAGAVLQDVAVSPDGKLLAAVGERGTVVLFETESGTLLKRLEGHTDTVTRAIFHPEGKWLASAGDDRRIILWSLPDGKILREWEAPDKVWTLALSPDGRLLASGGTDNNITLWETETGEEVQTLKGHERAIRDLAFSPNGSLLASAAYDYSARIWDLKSGESLHTLWGHTDKVEGVTFHPDGKILATASSDKNVRLWEVETGKPLAVLQGHKNVVNELTFVDSGERLVSGSFDRTLRVWDTASGVTLRVLQGHEAGVTGVAEMGNTLFSAGNDGKVLQWDIGDEKRFSSIDLPGEPTFSSIAPDGSSVVVGFSDGALRFYTTGTSKVVENFETLASQPFAWNKRTPTPTVVPSSQLFLMWENLESHTNRINYLAFSPDGKQLASASMDDTIQLWQVSDGELEQTFSGHTDGVYGVAFSPDGRFIASASFDGRIGLFEIGQEQGRFYPVHEGRVYSVAFDASGQRLVSAGEDGRTRLWDIATWPPALLWESSVFSEQLLWAAFSPDGNLIVSVGRDQLVHILNSGDGREEQRLIGHEQTILRAAFSPDSGQVTTVSADATVRLWDLTAGTELFAIRLPTNRGYPVPLWDFDFRCAGANCWIAVPLARGKLVLYYLERIYEE